MGQCFFISGILSVSLRIVCMRISLCTTRFTMLSNAPCQWCLMWTAKSLLNVLDIIPSPSFTETLAYICGNFATPVGLTVLQGDMTIRGIIYRIISVTVTMVLGTASQHHLQVIITAYGRKISQLLGSILQPSYCTFVSPFIINCVLFYIYHSGHDHVNYS